MSDVRNYSRKFITEFIELYKSLPALWKVKSKEYSDRNRKHLSYQMMIDKLKELEPDANRELVIKKINSLRTSYRKERKKVRNSQKSGTENVYVPSLWYFGLLQFLEDQENIQLSISNFDDSLLQIEINTDSINSTAYSELDLPSNPTSSSSVSPRGEQLNVNKKRKEVNNVITPVRQRLCETKAKDQHDVFGQYVANKLRNLPNDQRIYLEKLINDAIFEAELRNLSRGCYLHVPESLKSSTNMISCNNSR